jgi:diadenosine tetraphosphate (Ap4A) HIT family hydrolase
MNDCPFCNSPERILTENRHAFVIHSNPCKTENHLLVIPKRHVLEPRHLTHNEMRDIYTLITALQPKLALWRLRYATKLPPFHAA